MKSRSFAFLGLIGFVAIGCTTATVNKELVATGGSRADGTVQLGYEQANYQTVSISPTQGISTARERCEAWGYKDAQPFGGESRQCQVPNQYGCLQWMVTITYQCLN